MIDTKDQITFAPYGGKDGQANLPNPTQQKILDWVDKHRDTAIQDFDHIPVLLVMGGNGSGKTRGILAPCGEMLMEIPGINILWGRWDFKDLRLSAMAKFFEVFPSEMIKRRNEQYHFYDVKQEGESVGHLFFSGLKDLSGLGSQEFAVILVTEAHELTLQIYRALKRRCRQDNMPCMIIMETEPPPETHWLVQITNPESEEYDKDVEKFELSTYENWQNLPPAYRGSLESMPVAAKRRYLDGKPGFDVSGKPYYTGFNPFLHTVELEWNPKKELILGWDFGFHFPACLITQIDEIDRWMWLREIQGRDITIDKFAAHVTMILNEFYPDARIQNYGDPACKQIGDKSEKTSWQICKEAGFLIASKASTYRERKEIIERKLSTLHGSKPAILLDKRFCPICIDGFSGGYHYPNRREEQQFEGRFELPFKDGFYEHLMNAAEYIAVNKWRAVRTHQQEERQPNYHRGRQEAEAQTRVTYGYRQSRIYH